MPDEPDSESPQFVPHEDGGGTTLASRRRSRLRRGLALVVAVALVGGGAGAAFALSSPSSGAANPAAAVGDLLGAANHSDLLGALDAIAPGERQAIEPGLTGLVRQLERLGVLSSGTNLADISGFGLHFSKIAMTTQSLSSDLAAVTITSGAVTESVDPSKLPAGAFLSSLAGGSLRGGERSQTTSLRSGPSGAIVTEKVGGGWYVSLAYTIVVDALRAKGGSGAPPSVGGAITPSGGGSADDAVRAFIDDSAAFNLSGLIADFAPGEMGAVQTYARDLIGRAIAPLAKAEAEFHLKVTSVRFSDSNVSGGTLVKVSDVGLSASVRGTTIAIRGGCVVVTTPSTTTRRCPSAASRSAEDQRLLGVLPASLRSLGTRLLTTHPAIGIVAVNENGAWFVSPTATLLDDVDAYLSILRPQDLQAIVNLVRHPAEARAIARALEQLELRGATSGSSLF